MIVRDLYLRALDKLNKLISNNEQDVPEHIFVYNWNEAQYHWVANNYKLDEANRPLSSNLEDILVPFHEQAPSRSNNLYTIFDQPTDYLYYNNSYTVIDGCPSILENNLKRNQDIINLLKNSDWEPSVDFEQTLVTIAENKIFVYHDRKFEPKTLVLSYYKHPTKIDMYDGYTHTNGQMTKDVDPIWTKETILEEILDLTVKQIAENYSDMGRRQTMDAHIKESQQPIIK
jgi:hypothetical protein